MKRTAFIYCISLLAIASCGDDDIILHPVPTPADTSSDPDSQTDTGNGEPSNTDTTCKWWQEGCDEEPTDNDPAPDTITDDNSDNTDTITDSDPDSILANQLLGSWSGEYQWDISSKRLLYITYKSDGTISFVINPYGPSRINYSGYWEIVDGSLLMYDYQHRLAYTWENIKVDEAGKYFTYTGSSQDGTIKMSAGLDIPEEGLVAQVYTFKEDDKSNIYQTSGVAWIGGNLYFDSILLMLRDNNPKPVCTDWTYGVTSINYASNTLSINQISGFNRYGGSKCGSTKDYYIVDFYGSLNVPSGYSQIRFNTAKEEVVDAAIMFINDANGYDGVLSHMTEKQAALCNSDNWDITCLTDDSKPVYDINGGTTGGWLPFELVYVKLDGKAYLNVELAVGGNANFSPIAASRLTYPEWWK